MYAFTRSTLVAALMLVTLSTLVPGCGGAPPPTGDALATEAAVVGQALATPTVHPPIPSPTPSSEPTATLQLTATPTPNPTATPEPTAIPEPEEPQTYVNDMQVTVYLEPGEEAFGYLAAGKNFVFCGEQDGWLCINTAGVDYWVRAGELAYHGVGEEVPGILCERPYFQDRTEDRKTGYIYYIGNYGPEIKQPGVSWYFRINPDHPWLNLLAARITSIDRNSGVITFDIGEEEAEMVFTRGTEVMMRAHSIEMGMPSTESTRTGGNICDLEKLDLVAIVNYGGPGNLAGLLIVQ